MEKCTLDLDFLIVCKAYNIFPKFLKFKLYKRCLHRKKFYKDWQSKLLNNEINFKRRRINTVRGDVFKYEYDFKHKVSTLTFIFANNFIKQSLNKFITYTSEVHKKKLKTLGIHNSIKPCDPSSVVINLSSIDISDHLKFLLAFGLDFNLPLFKLDFVKYFFNFENLISIVKIKNVLNELTFKNFTKEVQNLSYKYYYNFKHYKIFNAVFTKKNIFDLKNLAKNKSIIVCKPDKGRGVVILNKADYLSKIYRILSDNTKFTLVSDDIFKTILKVEDKINRFLSKLKKLNVISSDLYSKLFISGSNPGILYGLPKTHKAGVPIRPIFSAIGTPSYNLSKFFVPILNPLTRNQYSVLNSYDFSAKLQNLSFNNCYIVSYDVESLFTNIPVHQTIDIIVDKLFHNQTKFHEFDRNQFKHLLELAVLNSYFIFDEKLYLQHEGVGMGLPLGPTLANAFMSHFETIWLNNCPLSFKPKLYQRYVDDCFAVFDNRNQAESFLKYLNSQHPNIKFTIEHEKDNKLSFLDILIEKSNCKFMTSVYRKPTFTGLGISFFSFIPFNFKISAVKSLIFRAYHVSSTFFKFHEELTFLKQFFVNNGFPMYIIDNVTKTILNKEFSSTSSNTTIVPKLDIYFKFMYFGVQSDRLKTELISLFDKYYPYIKPNIILVNNNRIKDIFRFKDRIPKCCMSSVVYKFSCASCGASYLGSTQKSLYCRVQQHAGKSFRTGLPLSKPVESSIREHCHNVCKINFSIDDFNVIDRESSEFKLRLLESVHIHKQKPELNNMMSASPLHIVNN